MSGLRPRPGRSAGLFYVAMTRARERLILSGFEDLAHEGVAEPVGAVARLEQTEAHSNIEILE